MDSQFLRNLNCSSFYTNNKVNPSKLFSALLEWSSHLKVLPKHHLKPLLSPPSSANLFLGYSNLNEVPVGSELVLHHYSYSKDSHKPIGCYWMLTIMPSCNNFWTNRIEKILRWMLKDWENSLPRIDFRDSFAGQNYRRLQYRWAIQ